MSETSSSIPSFPSSGASDYESLAREVEEEETVRHKAGDPLLDAYQEMRPVNDSEDEEQMLMPESDIEAQNRRLSDFFGSAVSVRESISTVTDDSFIDEDLLN